VGRSAGSRSPWAVLVVAVAMDAVAILPVGLVGVLALRISTDLGLAATSIGFVVSAFFLTGSVTAATLGPQIDRVGPRRSALLAGRLTSTCLALIAVAGVTPWLVGGACAAAGAGLAVTMPSTNAVLGTEVPASQRMLAVCAKQAAVPIALTVAAAMITLVDALGGWRVVFGGAAVAAIAVTSLFQRFTSPPRAAPATIGARAPTAGRDAQRAILRVGVSSMLASVLAGALTGYAALSLDAAGVRPVVAASVLAVSNSAGVVARLASGWRAQRQRDTSLRVVAGMMIAGGGGAFLLAVGTPATVSVGSVLAFGLGWGWSALTYAAILEANLDNPGATGAVIQSGGMAGSGTGPLVMAGLVGSFGLAAGWVAVGSAAVLAGLLLFGHRSAPAR
jgi:predicted MFS family arabinose efflux permease